MYMFGDMVNMKFIIHFGRPQRQGMQSPFQKFVVNNGDGDGWHRILIHMHGCIMPAKHKPKFVALYHLTRFAGVVVLGFHM
jgi:hypothetical protein